MLTIGDGNAFVLPLTQDGYLADLVPMPGAFPVDDGAGGYTVQWQGQAFPPGSGTPFYPPA